MRDLLEIHAMETRTSTITILTNLPAPPLYFSFLAFIIIWDTLVLDLSLQADRFLESTDFVASVHCLPQSL